MYHSSVDVVFLCTLISRKGNWQYLHIVFAVCNVVTVLNFPLRCINLMVLGEDSWNTIDVRGKSTI